MQCAASRCVRPSSEYPDSPVVCIVSHPKQDHILDSSLRRYLRVSTTQNCCAEYAEVRAPDTGTAPSQNSWKERACSHWQHLWACHHPVCSQDISLSAYSGNSDLSQHAGSGCTPACLQRLGPGEKHPDAFSYCHFCSGIMHMAWQSCIILTTWSYSSVACSGSLV